MATKKKDTEDLKAKATAALDELSDATRAEGEAHTKLRALREAHEKSGFMTRPARSEITVTGKG